MPKQEKGINKFQRYLSVWVLLCMAIGVLTGHFLPMIPNALDKLQIAGISIPIAILIWVMIYPMMMKVDFQSIKQVGKNPIHIVLIAVPLIIQTFLIFFIAYGACKLFKLPHDIAAPAGMIGASNFFELAVAVAIALFGTTSPAALATTVGVLTEVPVMLMLVRIANKTKARF
ncbi:arsenic resistance protein [Pseudobutyrivibrio sp.]